MGKVVAPSFKRKLALEERINSGKKIEGLTGFVPAETKCCSGRTTAYIPVKVVGIKLGDCSFAIRVKAITQEVIVSSSKEDTFTANPQNFFQTAEEIKAWEDYLKTVEKFKDAMNPFERHNGTLTFMRRVFKAALEEAPKLMKAEIEEDCSDKDEGVKAMSREWLRDNYRRMMIVKFFPEYAGDSEFNPGDYDEEDWE